MTLPYPPELEDGLLHPPAGGAPSAMDVRSVVEHMVEPAPGGIRIVGRELDFPASVADEDVLEQFRVVIADRILDRRPNLTIETVRHLEAVLRAELEPHERADRETLDVILDTIDGL